MAWCWLQLGVVWRSRRLPEVALKKELVRTIVADNVELHGDDGREFG